MLCKGRVKLSTTSSDGKTLILNRSTGRSAGLHATVSNTPYEITAESGNLQLNFIKRRLFAFPASTETHAEGAQHEPGRSPRTSRFRSLGLSLRRLNAGAVMLEWSHEKVPMRPGCESKCSNA